MPSCAESYFDRIISQPDPAAFLAALVGSTPPTFEQEWLEFKGEPRNDGDLKLLWSKAISGFGNTEGGVLVWGIDCRKVDGVDCVSSLNLITSPERTRSRLQELQHQTTNPPAQGIRIEHFSHGPDAPAGFVVCLIPESRSKPLRAEQVANQPYYIRSGTNFQIPSPALLRSLFYPMTRSRLGITVTPQRCEPGEPGKLRVRYEIRIRNRGSATAHDIRCVVACKDSIGFENPRGWPASGHPRGRGVIAGDPPLHPGDEAIVSVFSHQVLLPNIGTQPRLVPRRDSELTVDFGLFSRDHEAQYFRVHFDGLEMDQGIAKEALAVANPDECGWL